MGGKRWGEGVASADGGQAKPARRDRTLPIKDNQIRVYRLTDCPALDR